MWNPLPWISAVPVQDDAPERCGVAEEYDASCPIQDGEYQLGACVPCESRCLLPEFGRQ